MIARKRSIAVAVVAAAALIPAGSAMAQGHAASASANAKTAHCKRGKVAVHRGTLTACLKFPRNAAKTEPTRTRSVVKAAWYDNSGIWHTDGSIFQYERRWPYSGWYTGSGRYYYFDQWTERNGYNLTTLYRYFYWTGRWTWWGDYQCMGLNNGVYSDSCYWFPAR